jgi:excisionase family DNA binding protein
MSNYSFEDLPRVVSELNEKIDKLLAIQSQPEEIRDRFMDAEQLIEYLPENPARPTIYNWCAHRKIPYHKEGKKLLFKKSEIDQWLYNGRSMEGLR